MRDAYEIRREAERLIGEDRVPTDTLQEIVEQFGDPIGGTPDLYLVIATSAIAFTVKGEIVETVEWIDGKPDWTNAGICDHRGGGGDKGFLALHEALEAAEENYRLVFDEKPARLPD